MQRRKYSTKRLILRPLTLKDFKTWQAYYCLWGGTSKGKYDVPYYPKEECTRDVLKNILARHKKNASIDRLYVWGAFLKKTNELIGILDIAIIKRGDYQMANLGYRVGHRYWRQGFATEMIKCGCKKIAPFLQLQRLEAAINLDNPISMKTAKASGLIREGIKRKYLLENGVWTDNVIYIYLVN